MNDPDVYPLISVPGIDKLDVSEIVADPRNVSLVCEGGAIIFICYEPGIYEVHTNFLKDYRGRYAIRASLAAYAWMFTQTDCMKLLTRVPAFNKAAERFCSIVGATREFERNEAWPTENGMVSVSFWSMSCDAWIKRTPSLVESGRAFHDRAESEYARLGHEFPGHPEDAFHDRMAGACAEMIYGGQAQKGVIVYNRYAMFAGYPGISLVSLRPHVLIDTGDAVLQVGERDFKMVLCRLKEGLL